MAGSDSDDSEVKHVCYKCGIDDKKNDSDKWIGCDTCPVWSHIKCAFYSAIKFPHLGRFEWTCINCVAELKAYRKMNIEKILSTGFNKINEELKTQLQEVKMEIQGISHDILHTVDGVSAEVLQESASTVSNWSEVVAKGRKKNEKKNLLVLKATEANEKASDKKVEVSQALKDVQIKDSKFTSNGNIVMNFESEEILKDAAKKLGSVASVAIKSVKKLKPKVMICNVYKEESDSELIKTLIDRNECLKLITDADKK